jgi:hypothetical protein
MPKVRASRIRVGTMPEIAFKDTEEFRAQLPPASIIEEFASLESNSRGKEPPRYTVIGISTLNYSIKIAYVPCLFGGLRPMIDLTRGDGGLPGQGRIRLRAKVI